MSRSLLAETAASLRAPLEPILHASPSRLQRMGLFTIVGHPLFFVIWAYLIPQPFESPSVRLFIAAFGTILLVPAVFKHPATRRTQVLFVFLATLQLPLFMSWMYAMNHYSAVWMGTLACSTVIYFHMVDWRLAIAGSSAGLAISVLTAHSPIPADHAVIFSFAWAAGLLLAVSSANLRRHRLQSMLTTMGIMAHELRTPIAAGALVAEGLANETNRAGGARAEKIQAAASRILSLSRVMNHHISRQIANARLQLQSTSEATQGKVIASQLLYGAVRDFPFANEPDRACVHVVIVEDFAFEGSVEVTHQVISNLIQNAVTSIHRDHGALKPGDLVLTARRQQSTNTATIVAADCGTGISPRVLSGLFTPFFSTDTAVGHGLGLAFCRRAVAQMGGEIQATSDGKGATFTITVPCLSGWPSSSRGSLSGWRSTTRR